MRKLQICLISLFLIITIVFAVYVFYDRLMLDHTAPQIVCDGVPLQVSVTADDRALCAGLTAYDDVDGDISDRIIVRKVSKLTGTNTAMIYYTVFDSSSNYCTFTRSISYNDYCKPHFSLSQPLSFPPNNSITLNDRLTAYDVMDGDISQKIRVDSSAISTQEPGQYPLGLQITNSFGDTSILMLSVLIENTTQMHPTIQLSEYLRYVPRGSTLTEDDLRDMVVAVRENTGGQPVSAAQVTIDGSIDTETFGTYEVTFSYKNAAGLTRSVILTVVVE